MMMVCVLSLVFTRMFYSCHSYYIYMYIHIQEENQTAESKEAFTEKYGEDPRRDDLTIFVSKRDDPTDHIFVFFVEEAKVGVKSIKTVAERMRSDGVSRAIVVIQEKITPFAKQSLTEMQPKYMIELVCCFFVVLRYSN